MQFCSRSRFRRPILSRILPAQFNQNAGMSVSVPVFVPVPERRQKQRVVTWARLAAMGAVQRGRSSTRPIRRRWRWDWTGTAAINTLLRLSALPRHAPHEIRTIRRRQPGQSASLGICESIMFLFCSFSRPGPNTNSWPRPAPQTLASDSRASEQQASNRPSSWLLSPGLSLCFRSCIVCIVCIVCIGHRMLCSVSRAPSETPFCYRERRQPERAAGMSSWRVGRQVNLRETQRDCQSHRTREELSAHHRASHFPLHGLSSKD